LHPHRTPCALRICLRPGPHASAPPPRALDELDQDAAHGLPLTVVAVVPDQHEATGGGAAEVAAPLDQQDTHAEPGRRRRGRDASGATADDDDVGLVDDGNVARRLPDGPVPHGRRPTPGPWISGYHVDLPRAAASASQPCRIRTASLATSIAVSTPSLTNVSVTRLAATAQTLPPRSP